MKIAFFEIEQWESDYIKKSFDKAQDIILFFNEQKLNAENLGALRQAQGVTDAEVISVFVGSKINKEVVDAFPNLKLITTRSTGFDHIDLNYAREKGIATGYVPGYGDNTVAEFAFGLLLNLSRKIYAGADRIKETQNFSFEGLKGFDLNNKTIGIVGTGRIGQYSVKIARGFGMNVIAYDAYPNEKIANELGFKYVSFDDLLGQSDVITLHVPYIKRQETSDIKQGNLISTHHLINLGNINKIKKGAVLINTARGAIVETEALVKALNEGILAGAGLDVLEEEAVLQDEKGFALRNDNGEHNLKTVFQDHVLISMPNVLITPHMAFDTTEAIQRILDTDIQNIWSFMQGGKSDYPIPKS